MKKLASWFVPVCLMLVSTAMMTGCAVSSSATSTPSRPLTPPSSEYMADIVGRVTVISSSIVKAGKTLPTPVPGSQFWVVQLFVRNKGYQTPIRFGPTGVPWSIQTTSGLLGAPVEEIGSVPEWIGGSSVTILQGQEGQVTLLFIVSPAARQSSSGGVFFDVTPTPSNCKLRYIGTITQGSGNLQVDSFGSLVSTGTVVGVYDWDSQRIVQAAAPASPSPTRSVSPIPFGTYVATTAFGTSSVILNSDGTYAVTGGLMGKDVGTYILSSNQITFRSANPSVGSYTQSYTYSDQFKCLYMGSSSTAMIPYYRQ
jgi:hypothetical protein